jgi:hypothetical protein
VGVDVGRVRDVVAVLLEPADEIDLPVEELSRSVRRVWAVERDLDRARISGDRVGAVAVVRVQALAGGAIVRVVVVGLVGGDRLLVKEGRRASVLDHEDHVVLVALRIGEERDVSSGGPIAGDGQGVAGTPVAGDEPGGGIGRAGRLLRAVEGADMQAKAAAQASVPADAIEVDGVRLRRVDRDVERDVLVLEDAGRRGVALDLTGGVIGLLRADEPRACTRLLVLRDDGVGGGHRRRHPTDRGRAAEDEREQHGEYEPSHALDSMAV